MFIMFLFLRILNQCTQRYLHLPEFIKSPPQHASLPSTLPYPTPAPQIQSPSIEVNIPPPPPPKKMAEEEEAPTSLPAIAHPNPSPPAPPAQQPQQPQEEQQPAPPPIAPLPLAPTTYPIDTEMGEAAVCSFCRLYILLSICIYLPANMESFRPSRRPPPKQPPRCPRPRRSGPRRRTGMSMAMSRLRRRCR